MPLLDRVALQSLGFAPLTIPFKARFTHASAARSETSSVWITATAADGTTGFGESCPRSYVTNETVATAETFFRRHEASLLREIDSLPTLRKWARNHDAEIDQNPAAWCAIELALLDLLGKASRQPIETMLWLPPLSGSFHYTAVLGDSDLATFQHTAGRYQRMGFVDFKVKISGQADHDRQKLEWFARPEAARMRVRLDANNVWPDAPSAIAFLNSLTCPVFAVEEPVKAGHFADLAVIARETGRPIILDESVSKVSQVASLAATPDLWIVNLRVSKMGGLLRSLDFVAAARAAGLRIIVGAQVGETSLLTRAALTVAQAAGTSLVAQEGAFGTLLLERDVCDPPLMFGEGGKLTVASHPFLAAPGLGVVAQAGLRPVPGGRRTPV
jgi:L-alanine-DL-glutamate epimerase-like enolase superfamily enzyme